MTLEHLQVLSWFSRLTVAAVLEKKRRREGDEEVKGGRRRKWGRWGRRRSVATWVSNISRHCPSSFLPPRVIGSSYRHPSTSTPSSTLVHVMTLMRDDIMTSRGADQEVELLGDGGGGRPVLFTESNEKEGPIRPLIKEMRRHRKIEVLLLLLAASSSSSSTVILSPLLLPPPSSSRSYSGLLTEGSATPLRRGQKKQGLLLAMARRNAPNKYRSFTNCPRLIAPPNRPL